MNADRARFGAFLFTSHFDGLNEAEVLSAMLRYADTAERHGFDDLWVDEHHFIRYGINPSALTLAGFLLARTTRVRVGTAVVLLPQLPPVFVAEQAALLDHLSGGRFDLGLGRGAPSADLPVAGRRVEHWSRGYWPAVDLLRTAWTGAVGADTELHRFPEVTVRPVPRTPGGPPLFTASTSESSLEQAARRGIPLLLFLDESDRSRRTKVERWAEVAAEHGHPTDHPGHAFAVIGQATEPGDSPRELADRLHAFFVRSFADYVWLPEAATAADDPSAHHHTPEQLREYVDRIIDTHPVGPPERCARRLAASIEASGVDRVLLMLEAGADPDRVARNITTFGTEVLPAVRGH